MWKSLWSLCVRFVKTLWKDFCPPFVQVLSSLSLFVILVRGSIDGWDKCVIIYKVNLDASVSTISSLIQPIFTLSSLCPVLCLVRVLFVIVLWQQIIITFGELPSYQLRPVFVSSEKRKHFPTILGICFWFQNFVEKVVTLVTLVTRRESKVCCGCFWKRDKIYTR